MVSQMNGSLVSNAPPSAIDAGTEEKKDQKGM